MVGLRRVKISADAVATGVGGGGHVSAVQNVASQDFGVVKDDWEALGIEQSDDFRVRRDEDAGRHVCAEDCGLVFFYSGFEEIVSALVVEVVIAIFDVSKKWPAIVSRDWLQWKVVW